MTGTVTIVVLCTCLILPKGLKLVGVKFLLRGVKPAAQGGFVAQRGRFVRGATIHVAKYLNLASNI